MRTRFPTLAALVSVTWIACGPADDAATRRDDPDDARPKITNQDQLPRHTYEVDAAASEIVTSEAAFAPLAAAVRSDIEALLADYEIEDRATLESLEGTLLNLDMLAGKIVVSMANALIRVGKEFQPLVPPRGSVAAHVQAAVPDSRVVAAFHHLPATELGLMVSGRASFELMQKTLVAGMPLLAAVSAPSSLAAVPPASSRFSIPGA